MINPTINELLAALKIAQRELAAANIIAPEITIAIESVKPYDVDLEIRRLIKKGEGWHIYANYLGNLLINVELIKGDTTWRVECIWDLDGITERLPDFVIETARVLFK